MAFYQYGQSFGGDSYNSYGTNGATALYGNYGAGQAMYGGSTPRADVINVASQIKSHTSSSDPESMKSRVFVGNLMTDIVTRDQLIALYSPFGKIDAISMHKGFAFVQFTTEGEARNAVSFTDGHMLGGKSVDVTISCEPKKASDKKRPTPSFSAPSHGTDDTKRFRTSAWDYKTATAGGSVTVLRPPNTATPKSDDTIPQAVRDRLSKKDDALVCGKCSRVFGDVQAFTGHKQQCDPAKFVECVARSSSNKAEGEPEKLQCFICHLAFDKSWPLIKHMSEAHHMTVYETTNEAGEVC